MRPQAPAIIASAVVAAGTVYLSHSTYAPKVIAHHAHAPVSIETSSVDVAATATPLPEADSLTIYHCAIDGHTMVPQRMRLGEAHDIESVAYLAAVKTVAGPADTVKAIRFPVGTSVRAVRVVDDTATVDLSSEVEQTSPGGFSEIGEFKSLVWTVTNLPGLNRVRVRVAGATVPTLPGGHLELDEPLSRTDF